MSENFVWIFIVVLQKVCIIAQEWSRPVCIIDVSPPPWAFRNLELWINSGHPQPSRLFHSEKPFVGSLAVFVLPPNILRGRFIVIAAVLCSAAATECLHHTWDIQRIETVDPVIYCTPAPSSGDLLNGVKRYVIPVWQTYNWLHARIHAFIKSYFLQLLHSPFYSLKHLAAAKTALIFCVIRAAICHCHQCHLSLPWWPQRCLAMSMMMRWLQTQGNVGEVLWHYCTGLFHFGNSLPSYICLICCSWQQTLKKLASHPVDCQETASFTKPS